MTPYTPAYAAAALANYSDALLARITPVDFRRWPTPVPLDPGTARKLIAQERARRAGAAGPRLL